MVQAVRMQADAASPHSLAAAQAARTEGRGHAPEQPGRLPGGAQGGLPRAHPSLQPARAMRTGDVTEAPSGCPRKGA